MQLFLTTCLHLEEHHPRDRVWLNVYADRKAAEEFISENNHFDPAAQIHIHTMSLPLEPKYQSHSQRKLPSLPIDSMEVKIVQALRELARSASASPMNHAYRCLATCLENYARYGGENAVTRVLALAYRLSQQHTSKPYRVAFAQAYSEMSTLLTRYDTHPATSEQIASTPPKRVFYTLALHTFSTPSFPVHIRLFQHEQDAAMHLTDMLREYGIPYEVWRSLRGVIADEHLPYAQDGLFFSMGEKKVMT